MNIGDLEREVQVEPIECPIPAHDREPDESEPAEVSE